MLDLFSGIGGFSLAATWVWGEQLEIVSFCESDPFCQKVLKKHWPTVPIAGDVRCFDATSYRDVDLLCGGFPCQDLSVAGRSAGLTGSRSGLWGEMLRIIGECRPRWIIIENVYRGWRRWVPSVRRDLHTAGYSSLPLRMRACEVGLPHERLRCYIVANADSERLRILSGWVQRQSRSTGTAFAIPHGTARNACNADQIDEQEQRRNDWRTIEPCLVRGVHGVSHRVDRVKALGNSIVPQLVAILMQKIKDHGDE